MEWVERLARVWKVVCISNPHVALRPGAPKGKEMVLAFADLSDELIEVLDGIITDPACPTDTMCVLYPTYGVSPPAGLHWIAVTSCRPDPFSSDAVQNVSTDSEVAKQSHTQVRG